MATYKNYTIELGGKTITPVTVDVRFNPINVTSDHPTADPNWTGTDSHGHAHHYDNGYPTLNYVIDIQHWCDGREGTYHDPHWAVDEAHYECVECGDTVAPGVSPAGTPQWIPGLREVTVKAYADPVEVDGVIGGQAGRFIPVTTEMKSGEDPLMEFVFIPS